ncbi:hypothetical protein SAMN05660226_01460 [Parapedobacter luteus]|uniref:Uncharacterized protein n=1 Tax=Parapedobacter luteus TaxID=623280 RepID=A0A1T5BGX9_9SPHI|nr:hypothetical protein SAMN05660226_01460 [Parapedobacter luteus]
MGKKKPEPLHAIGSLIAIRLGYFQYAFSDSLDRNGSYSSYNSVALYPKALNASAITELFRLIAFTTNKL